MKSFLRNLYRNLYQHLTLKSSSSSDRRTKTKMPLDWEKIRPDVQRLYKDEDKPLADVITFVEQKYGFQAS
jgi:hypothetical protein